MAKTRKDSIDITRGSEELRVVKVETDFTSNALSSILYSQGNTKILVCVTKAPSLPRWFPRDASKGWVHAEYSLLPGSTDTRFRRERTGAKGRTQEIERLIARSLRGSIDLEALGPIALTIDCDVLNADGGTRCASITAACIAMRIAVRRLIASGECLPEELRASKEEIKNGWIPPSLSEEKRRGHENKVMPYDVAALSVGLLDGKVWTDLDYVLDSNADVDMNVVMTSNGEFVEVQGTGEESTYSRKQLEKLLDSAAKGISKLHDIQKEIVASV